MFHQHRSRVIERSFPSSHLPFQSRPTTVIRHNETKYTRGRLFPLAYPPKKRTIAYKSIVMIKHLRRARKIFSTRRRRKKNNKNSFIKMNDQSRWAPERVAGDPQVDVNDEAFSPPHATETPFSPPISGRHFSAFPATSWTFSVRTSFSLLASFFSCAELPEPVDGYKKDDIRATHFSFVWNFVSLESWERRKRKRNKKDNNGKDSALVEERFFIIFFLGSSTLKGA